MGLTLTNHDTSIQTFKRWHSPVGFVFVSELLATCDQFYGSSPEQWRQRLLWGRRRRSFKKGHTSKGPIYRQAQMEILTIPFVLGEPVGGFFLGLLLLQQRQKPLLLLTRAVHEVIPWLREQERNKVNVWRNDCFIRYIMNRWSITQVGEKGEERVHLGHLGHLELERSKLRTIYLDVVSIGAGLSEDGWNGWVTAHFQIIFGTFISFKKICKEPCWWQE